MATSALPANATESSTLLVHARGRKLPRSLPLLFCFAILDGIVTVFFAIAFRTETNSLDLILGWSLLRSLLVIGLLAGTRYDLIKRKVTRRRGRKRYESVAAGQLIVTMIVSLYTVWTNTSTPSDISNNTKHIFTTMFSSFLSTDPADGSDEIDEMQWRTFYLFASFAFSLGHYTFFTAFISATSRDRSRRVNFDVTDTPSRRQSGDSGFTVESERD